MEKSGEDLNEVNERSEKSKEWLLKDQERRLDMMDGLHQEYEGLNVTFTNLGKMVEELLLEQKRVDDQMTNLRYRIKVQETKVREANKIMRDRNDPSIKNPKEG